VALCNSACWQLLQVIGSSSEHKSAADDQRQSLVWLQDAGLVRRCLRNDSSLPQTLSAPAWLSGDGRSSSSFQNDFTTGSRMSPECRARAPYRQPADASTRRLQQKMPPSLVFSRCTSDHRFAAAASISFCLVLIQMPSGAKREPACELLARVVAARFPGSLYNAMSIFERRSAQFMTYSAAAGTKSAAERPVLLLGSAQWYTEKIAAMFLSLLVCCPPAPLPRVSCAASDACLNLLLS